MSPVIAALLQGVAPQDDGGPDIQVEGRRSSIEAPAVDIQSVPEMERQTPTLAAIQEIIPRKGMFGVKGTLRDVLGTLGDAFLVQGGKSPIYRPQRDKEKLGSAMYGFSSDDSSARNAAIERVAALGESDVAARMQQQNLQADQYRQAALVKKAEVMAKGFGIVGSLANSITDPVTYKSALPILEKINQTYGLELDIPEEYSPDNVTGWRNRALSVDDYDDNARDAAAKKSAADSREGQLAVSRERASTAARQGDQRLAETSRHNRAMEAKPSGSSRQPNPTAASIAAPILKKIQNGQPITPAERQVLSRTGFSEDKGTGKSKRRQPPPLPPGFQLKTRN